MADFEFAPSTNASPPRAPYPTIPPDGPGIGDVGIAAFRQGNSVVSALQAVRSMGAFEPVDGYSPWDEIKDKPQYLERATEFAGFRSPAETKNLMDRIDTENADRRTLAASGVSGIIASTIAGALDPTMLLPGRVAIGVLKDGTPLVRGALEVGGAMAAQSTTQEAVLQASQANRPLSESVVSVGSATILGALLGGAAAWLSPAEHAAAVAGLDRDRARMDAHVTGAPETLPEIPTLPVIQPPVAPSADGAIPAFVLQNRAAAISAANSLGLTSEIERLAKSGKTAKEISDAIGGALSIDDIRAVRDSLGIQAAGPLMTPGGAAIPGGSGLATAAGAAAADTRKLDLVKTGVGIEKLGLDPTLSILNQPSIAARRAYADVAELSVMVSDNLPVYAAKDIPEADIVLKDGSTQLQGSIAKKGDLLRQGQPSTFGSPPLETIYRTENLGAGVALRDKLLEQWGDLRFGRNAGTTDLAKEAVGLGKSEAGLPTFEEFKTMVSDAMMFGDQHEIPQVAAAAQYTRQNFEKWADRAEKAVPDFEKLEPKEGEGYFPHRWNKPKITDLRPEFTNKITAKFVADQATKQATQRRLQGLSENLEKLQKRIERLGQQTGKEIELADAVMEHDALRARIEQEIGAWEGRSASEAKSALKAREKYAEKTERPEGESRLRSADKSVDAAVRRIVEAGDKYDRDVGELRDRAHQTVERILGSPDGRLSYDESSGVPSFGPSSTGEPPRGSLGSRMLDVSNEFARDWIERDIEKVQQTFNHTFIPDVLLAEKFGDVGMEVPIRRVNEEYAALIDATGPGAERKKLEAQRQKALENIAMVRDRLRGTYNIPVTASQRRMGRVSAAVRNGMVPLNMGMAAISSLPDMAGVVFQWGMMSAFKDGYLPFVKSLMSNREYSKEALRQAKVMSIAIDTATATRHHEMSGIFDHYQPGSPTERALQWGANKFQLLNGLGPFTDFVKTISTTVNATNLYRATKAAAGGTATKKQLMELGQANIPNTLYEKIAEQYETHGTKVDGVLLPNTEAWTRETREAFESALSRNANINVVTPGLDKPGLFSDPLAAILLQFKSFTAAASTRILIANLQRADAQTLQGLIASLGVGMMSYKLNAILGGQPTSDRPQDWIKEAMSRGNIFGWLEEGNALASKATGGKADIYRLIGANKPVSRFASQDAIDQLLGPTVGKMKDMTKITSAAGHAVAGDTSGGWSAGDSKAVRRMIATQNLWWLRGAFNQVEAGANSAFGIPQKKQ